MENNKQLKIYLVSQNTNKKYDTYDKMVVVAHSEDRAILVSMDFAFEYEWAKPSNINAELIGTDTTDQGERVILASYNAG